MCSQHNVQNAVVSAWRAVCDVRHVYHVPQVLSALENHHDGGVVIMLHIDCSSAASDGREDVATVITCYPAQTR